MAELLNRHAVGRQGGDVVLLTPPREPMTEREAYELAAWLFLIAGGDEEHFERICRQIKRS